MCVCVHIYVCIYYSPSIGTMSSDLIGKLFTYVKTESLAHINYYFLDLKIKYIQVNEETDKIKKDKNVLNSMAKILKLTDLFHMKLHRRHNYNFIHFSSENYEAS